jgi:hypothetical protein
MLRLNEIRDLVGWREWVHLPHFTKLKIKAKIDTGAKSCAIHAEDINFYTRNKKHYVKFKLLPTQKSDKKTPWIHAELIEYRKVTSSTGHESLRPTVRTQLILGTHKVDIDITLVRRDMMGFRFLIGRDALRGFFVDPESSFLVSKKYNKSRSHS